MVLHLEVKVLFWIDVLKPKRRRDILTTAQQRRNKEAEEDEEEEGGSDVKGKGAGAFTMRSPTTNTTQYKILR